MQTLSPQSGSRRSETTAVSVVEEEMRGVVPVASGPKVSVIMPAYNEERQIAKSIAHAKSKLNSLRYDHEIIVVDDGSTDGTLVEATKMARDESVRVLGYGRNQGKGYALMFGVRQAMGDVLVFMDSDNEIKPDLIEHYVQVLRHADIAIASKRHPESVVRSHPLRKFLSLGFRVMVSIMTGVGPIDTQSGFKACRASSMQRILPLLSVKRYAFDVELFTVARLLRLRIVQMPIRISLGSLFSVRAIARMFVDLLGITYRLRIIHWYQKNLHTHNARYEPIIRW